LFLADLCETIVCSVEANSLFAAPLDNDFPEHGDLNVLLFGAL
jgi:hypothetical protein